MKNQKHIDLAIAYRVYPGISKTPFVHADNKFELVKLCARSLKASLGDLKYKIWVLLDNCPQEYEEFFLGEFHEENIEIIRLKGAGNRATFLRQLEILRSQDLADYVYFAEDDYVYRPKQFVKMIALLRDNKDAHFVSPYDHLDYYASALHHHKSEIKLCADCHWRKTNSSCLTFMAPKQVLIDKYRVLESYGAGCRDSSLWLSLTKIHVDPWSMVKYFFADPRVFRIILGAWRYGWKNILFGSRSNLWTPIPSIATHAESRFIAPAVDWEQVIEQLNSQS